MAEEWKRYHFSAEIHAKNFATRCLSASLPLHDVFLNGSEDGILEVFWLGLKVS